MKKIIIGIIAATDKVKVYLHDLAHTDGEDLTFVKADQ